MIFGEICEFQFTEVIMRNQIDINKLLAGVDCACGKRHTCEIEWVYIEENAIKQLSNICAGYQNILLVADENTYGVAGENTVTALKGKSIRKIIFPGNRILIPDEKAIARVQAELSDIDLIIGIGSGVIQDLCKYISFYNKVPYMIVATAPSMDGYASNGAAMITEGMKVTYSAGLPLAIIADTSVLKNAPVDMIRSGYGDIIGKYSALNDWKLSNLVNDEYFCEYIYNLTFEQIERTIEVADKILKRDEDGIKRLMEALIIIGIMMSLAESSRPASGSEHHLSHFFEITGIIDGTDYLPHGTDVAYSTFVTAELREKIRSSEFPDKIYRESKEDYEKLINNIYKDCAKGCIDLQNRVGNYKKNRIDIYLSKKDEIKAILSRMPSSAYIKSLLSNAGFNMDYFYNFYGEEKIKNALGYAKDLKDRYTVLWLYYDLFGCIG